MDSDFIEDSRFSDLPEDVGKLIFEFVAGMDKETGRSCALISNKIKFWVEPILYRTIIIRTPIQLRNFCRIIQHPESSKPRDFFSLHVKALVIPEIYEDDDTQHPATILAILKACRNVEILVIWGMRALEGPSSNADALRSFIKSPKLSLRQLSFNSGLFPEKQCCFSYPTFQNATHVDLVWQANQSGLVGEADWSTLKHLLRLTHLSFCLELDTVSECSQWVGEIIGLCPSSLKVFIIWLGDAFFQESNREFAGIKAIDEGEVDVRAVVAYAPVGTVKPETITVDPIIRSYEDIIRDLAGIPVGKDFWTLAEEKIEERLRRRMLQNHD